MALFISNYIVHNLLINKNEKEYLYKGIIMSKIKWSGTSEESLLSDKPLHVVTFVARNKDNHDIKGFKERRNSFLTTEEQDSEKLLKKFENFKNEGLSSELSRMYISVNARKAEKTKKDVLSYMILQDNLNMAAIQTIAVTESMKRENAAEHKILFDIDFTDENLLHEFVQDLIKRGADENKIEIYSTVNGFSVVTERGAKLLGLVDTMPDVPLEEKKDKGPWKWSQEQITYKIDALLLLKSDIK